MANACDACLGSIGWGLIIILLMVVLGIAFLVVGIVMRNRCRFCCCCLGCFLIIFTPLFFFLWPKEGLAEDSIYTADEIGLNDVSFIFRIVAIVVIVLGVCVVVYNWLKNCVFLPRKARDLNSQA